jgi:uncharacterized protein YndB with AHSA1/START domain
MEKYKITIDAPKEKVWNTLWGNDTYPQWTSAFAEGSRAETDWKKGSKVLFVDGKGSGIVSTIAENKPNEYMSFEHLAVMKDGKVEEGKENEWAGSFENYTLKSVDGKTELTIDMISENLSQEMVDYFRAIWPKALDKLKALAENN